MMVLSSIHIVYLTLYYLLYPILLNEKSVWFKWDLFIISNECNNQVEAFPLVCTVLFGLASHFMTDFKKDEYNIRHFKNNM